MPDWWQSSMKVGCLYKVLPLGGPDWVGKLVVIVEIIDTNIPGRTMYRILDSSFNSTTLPYYALIAVVE